MALPDSVIPSPGIGSARHRLGSASTRHWLVVDLGCLVPPSRARARSASWQAGRMGLFTVWTKRARRSPTDPRRDRRGARAGRRAGRGSGGRGRPDPRRASRAEEDARAA
ncbi:hypothetical protein ACU686_23250 [Yinghuangia aomiensis]